MMIVHILNRIEQIVIPGMVTFYDRFETNPLADAYAAMDAAASDSSSTTLQHAAIQFERKIERLAKLYKEFLEITQNKGKPSFYDFFLEEGVQLSRSDVLCDECKEGPKLRKWLKLFQTYKVKDKEPEQFISCLCDVCSVKVNK